jgi:hypothetical protein
MVEGKLRRQQYGIGKHAWDWQDTTQGEREVRQVLRRTLLKYKLHTDQELFDKAYGYIREYY